MRSKTGLILIPLAAALTVAACSGGGGSSSPNAAVAGAWKYASGPLISGVYPSLGNVGYLQLATSGTGMLFVSTPAQAVPGCEPLGFAVLNDTDLTVDFPDFTDSTGSSVMLFRYSVSGDTLTLLDFSGASTTFQRTASVPAAATCSPAPVAASLPIPASRVPDFSYRPTFTADATHLWFHTAAGANLAFDPATGTTGASVTFPTGGQFQFVRAVQGANFWIDCECGHNTQMELRTPADAQVAAFDLSQPPISRDFDIGAAAYDGTALWVAGYDLTRQVPGVMKLDVSVSPPAVLLSYDFDLRLDGIAFRTGSLWASGRNLGEEVLQLTTGGTVQGTFVLPRDGGIYGGLANVGGSLYDLHGDAAYANGKVLKLGL